MLHFTSAMHFQNNTRSSLIIQVHYFICVVSLCYIYVCQTYIWLVLVISTDIMFKKKNICQEIIIECPIHHDQNYLQCFNLKQ